MYFRNGDCWYGYLMIVTFQLPLISVNHLIVASSIKWKIAFEEIIRNETPAGPTRESSPNIFFILESRSSISV